MTNEQLYTAIRAGFVSKGTSLNKWCKQNGYHRQNAYAAVMGIWKGEKATQFLDLLLSESGHCIQTDIQNPLVEAYLVDTQSDAGLNINEEAPPTI